LVTVTVSSNTNIEAIGENGNTYKEYPQGRKNYLNQIDAGKKVHVSHATGLEIETTVGQ
jgi:hypothetical protein